MNNDLQAELGKIQEALVSNELTDKQYCELYAAQQALIWASDPNIAASPFDTVMGGKIQPPARDIPLIMDTQAD